MIAGLQVFFGLVCYKTHLRNRPEFLEVQLYQEQITFIISKTNSFAGLKGLPQPPPSSSSSTELGLSIIIIIIIITDRVWQLKSYKKLERKYALSFKLPVWLD